MAIFVVYEVANRCLLRFHDVLEPSVAIEAARSRHGRPHVAGTALRVKLFAIGSQQGKCYSILLFSEGRQGSAYRVSKIDSLQVFLAAQPDLIRYATRITGDPAEAEDVVQDAWLRFRATFNARILDEPSGYLFRIVHNLALDKRRRQGRENGIFVGEASVAAELVPSGQPSQQAAAEAKDELAMLHEALASLPIRTRRAFEMHRFDEMKLVEIASELGISKSLASELVIEAVEVCKKALRRHH